MRIFAHEVLHAPGRLTEGGTMPMLADLLREVLRMGDGKGVRYVRSRHVPEGTFAQLAYLTHDHAFTVGREGNSAGERIYDAGILPWWRDEGGLSQREVDRLYQLRSDVVDWLEEQGLASRSHPRSTPLHVWPRSGAAPAEEPEPTPAQQPPGRERVARSADDVWMQIQAICREAIATGRTIATIDRGIANRILDVRPTEIVRASDDARTPDGQGAPVRRLMVEHLWQELVSGGHAGRISGVLFFAYALVAEIPGVAVDNDRHGIHIADWDLAMTPYQEGSGVGTSTPGRSYWTLAAHPARYRVVDAVRNLDEDWWTTGGADIHAGDRVAIWKYKGRDEYRGIVAFGEVLTDPEMHDDDSPFWIDSDAKAAALRMRVRYVIKPSAPLWLELAPAGSVIRRLPVSRAQGGTAHHVTADEWSQLMTLAGGWPQPDTHQDDGASGWSYAEIQPTVTAYFAMLQAELAGLPYIKANFNREVQDATGRSRGAVDYKFENISAVLSEIGLPYVLGYKPYGNYQSALRTEVERFLAHDPEIARLLEQGPAPDLPPTAQLVEVDPPVMPPPSTTGRGRTTVGVDYLQRQARNREVGRQGELLVVAHEREWLSANGLPELAKRVLHVPSTLGDGAGYDVSSFLLDGSPHHIEVKATRGSITAPFFLSASERRYALEHPGAYSIYRIFDLGPNPGFYKLTGDLTEILDLTPVTYQARVKAPAAHSTGQGEAGAVLQTLPRVNALVSGLLLSAWEAERSGLLCSLTCGTRCLEVTVTNRWPPRLMAR